MGINDFSDWTPDELSTLLGAMELNNSNLEVTSIESPAVLAGSVDWRSRMPAVKNQGGCGSCWAFSAIDVVDFFGGSHSEQQLLDCSGGSCNGYSPSRALQYLARTASATESQYPYSGRQGSCHHGRAATRVFNVRRISGAYSIMAALQHQVVSVSFQLSRQGSPFMSYKSGIYDQPCGHGAGHAVAAVGYGRGFWIIRNSWGPRWGEGGYVMFSSGRNLCGLETQEPVIAQARRGEDTDAIGVLNETSSCTKDGECSYGTCCSGSHHATLRCGFSACEKVCSEVVDFMIKEGGKKLKEKCGEYAKDPKKFCKYVGIKSENPLADVCASIVKTGCPIVVSELGKHDHSGKAICSKIGKCHSNGKRCGSSHRRRRRPGMVEDSFVV